MSPDLPENIVLKIEEICALGCSQVGQLLKKAKNGDPVQELAEFNQAESEIIINELTQIMSVYDGKCIPPSN
jgi:hypothetical protein